MASFDQDVKSYLKGEWVSGEASGREALVNPATGETIAHVSTAGLDLSDVLSWARTTGGPALRAMTFAERGAMLGDLAKAIHEHRERLIEIAIANGGNTRKDAKFDIDGATGTLQFYAYLGKKVLGDVTWLDDGDSIQLGRSGRWMGQHILVPRNGVAVHINAFNFPAWGPFEKAAVAWLAGMPVLTKPAPATALLTAEIGKIVVDSGILPAGAFQLLSGDPGDLLDHVGPQDAVAFTGSSRTGAIVRGHEQVVARGVAVNVEADSVNAAVLGADVETGDETWHLFLNDVSRDITQKAGQKCTAVRRILVPESRVDDVQEAIIDRLSGVTVGDPSADGVDMGPVTNATQRAHVLEGIAALVEAGATKVYGEGAEVSLSGESAVPDAFVGPTLLRVDDADAVGAVHTREVFGPVATIVVYDGTAETAADIVNRGEGGLVTSIYSDDTDFARDVAVAIGPYHGRIYIGDKKCAAQAMGPGVVLPQMVHGGPGRAGCGEELGGERGLHFYMQRVGIQGSRKLIGRVFGS